VRLAYLVAFAQQGKLRARLELLDLVDGDGERPGHIAVEDYVSICHTYELAGEAIAVGEDEDVGGLGGGFDSGFDSGGGLSEDKRGRGKKEEQE